MREGRGAAVGLADEWAAPRAELRDDKPESWVLGITRTYRMRFLPDHGFTVYLPAPFRTIHTYAYGPDGRVNPVSATRHG